MKLLLLFPHATLHPLDRLRAWRRLLAAGAFG